MKGPSSIQSTLRLFIASMLLALLVLALPRQLAAAVPDPVLEWIGIMNSTVIADKFVPASQLCAGKYAKDCTAAGISG